MLRPKRNDLGRVEKMSCVAFLIDTISGVQKRGKKKTRASNYTCGLVLEALVSLDAKATPYFSFCLSTRAAAIQTSVRLHTLFSGEPAEIQPFSTLLLLRPVCEQRAGRGGDFSFCSDLISPPPLPSSQLSPVVISF